MIEIKSRTYSYLSGLPDRDFQEKIWRIWANASNKVFNRPEGKMVPKGLRFNGKAYAVLSFIAELVSFVEYGEALPFEELYVPENLVTWPEDIGSRAIQQSYDFFEIMLEMFGVRISPNFSPNRLVIVVDPHLLDDQVQNLLGSQLAGRQIVVLTNERQPLPQPFRTLLFDNSTDMYLMPWSTVGPLALPPVRDVIRNSNASGITVVGAGRRLPVAIIQAADLCLLFQTEPVFKYKDRRSVVNDTVDVNSSFSLFDGDWYNNEGTVQQAFLAYLQNVLGCTTYPEPQVNQQELDLEFLVRGHLVPVQ